jgi:colicin import membrane protein
MATDATTEKQDAIPEGDADSATTPAVPSSEPEMLTREQAEKLANERHSKLDKRIAEQDRVISRATKAIEAAEARAEAAERALAEAERAKEESEYESVRGNPDALTTWQAKKAVKDAEAKLAKERAALEKEKSENAEALAEATEYKKIKAASEIASKYEGVEASELIELTDGSPEKMEKMAQRLGKPKESQPAKPKPDSGAGKGGPGKPTLEQLENWSEEEYMRWAKDRFK